MLESGENYLKKILTLKRDLGYVRAVDLANAMGFSKASISRAIGILCDEGYLFVEKSGKFNGNLVLTELGLAKANSVLEKFSTISKFLQKCLGVDEEIAEKDACAIEHVISDETFMKIKEYIKKR